MRKTYLQIVVEKLNEMEVGDQFDFKEFVKDHWGRNDFFAIRSFDVFFCEARKRMTKEVFVRDGRLSTIKRVV